MKIVMVRVDGRLIHGQVTTGFARRTSANLILVANDEVAKDKGQQSIMKLAAPSGVKIEIMSLKEALQRMAKRRWPNAKILLLLRSPVDLLRLMQMGLTVQKVNVGGVNNAGATIKITNEVYATPEELDAWKKLDEMGVDMSVQWEISASSTDLNKALRKHQ